MTATAASSPTQPHTIPALRPRISAVVLSHAAVDFFSYLIIPILTVLEGRLSLSPGQGAGLLAVGSLSSGMIQPVVALISDRFDTRWLGTLGFVVAVAALCVIGWVRSFEELLLIQILATAGIGAFHPIAAAAMGQLSGRRRSLGVSIFYAAGLFGSVAGSAWTAFYVSAHGVRAIASFGIPAAIFIAALAWAIHDIPHRHAGAHADHAALPREERRRRWTDIGLLYAGNVVRFTVNMMLVQLVIRWCDARVLADHGAAALDAALRAESSHFNGPIQAAMQLGMGASGLMAGIFLRRHHEKAALIAVPIVGTAAVWFFPAAGTITGAMLLAIVMGAGYAGMMPITITMAQRLLPHRTSLASGLMMGGAWGVAAVGPPLAQWLVVGFGLERSFQVAAALLAASVFLTIPLRRTVDPARR